MARTTESDVLLLLQEAGADVVAAEEMVELLRAAGLSPPRMRAWLSTNGSSYSVTTGFITAVPGEPVPWTRPPVDAIEDGHLELVMKA
ncbi:MAG: hypothetical protein QOF76_2604, partial [Solirubrobacteraceae bacterium]|nr:hypothetical protein [Solirubrobacteraceae bacterium]